MQQQRKIWDKIRSEKVNTKYQDRGFAITDYHGDNEFEPIQFFIICA